MEKLYKQPYKNKKYAEDYNDYWVHQEDIKPSVDLEIKLVEDSLESAFDIKFVFNHFTLGEEFCKNTLGISSTISFNVIFSPY